MTVPDKQATERYIFNKKSVQGENEGSASNRNGEIELNKQADEQGYEQRYPEEGLFERGHLKKIIKRLADGEKAKRKVEGDLKLTQEAVAYLKRNKKEIDPSNIIQRKDDESHLIGKLQKQIQELQKRIEELEEEVCITK
ncbi:MYSA protein, partial [Acromyrmex heyeri]